MIYAFFGTDYEKVRNKAHAWILASRTKDPQLTYIRMTNDSFDENLFHEALEGQSLFAKRMLISLDSVCADHEEILLSHIKNMQASSNVFALIEGKLSAKTARALDGVVEKSFVFDKAGGSGKPNFALWNAIDKRNGVLAWCEYQKERNKGAQPEMIAGFIHSKLRKNMAKNKDAQKDSRVFIDIYHSARRGEIDFEEGLELFLLKLA